MTLPPYALGLADNIEADKTDRARIDRHLDRDLELAGVAVLAALALDQLAEQGEARVDRTGELFLYHAAAQRTALCRIGRRGARLGGEGLFVGQHRPDGAPRPQALLLFSRRQSVYLARDLGLGPHLIDDVLDNGVRRFLGRPGCFLRRDSRGVCALGHDQQGARRLARRLLDHLIRFHVIARRTGCVLGYRRECPSRHLLRRGRQVLLGAFAGHPVDGHLRRDHLLRHHIGHSSPGALESGPILDDTVDLVLQAGIVRIEDRAFVLVQHRRRLNQAQPFASRLWGLGRVVLVGQQIGLGLAHTGPGGGPGVGSRARLGFIQ